MTRPSISVVVPAHNAKATIARALASLQAQTADAWEAIVVDDGSTDGTGDVVRDVAARDPRIRVVCQAQQGASAARNTGIGTATADLILFLDADDWIAPAHMATLLGALGADPSLDAVYSGWARVTPDGDMVPEWFHGRPEDLAAALRTSCSFSIHSCLVPRAAIVGVGGFDTSLRTCEDWDLWQRVVRSGVRFGVVEEVLAYYRLRSGSLSLDAVQLLRDGLRVVERGHLADPRIPAGPGREAPTLPAGELESTQISLFCWTAGLALGQGVDARPLLDEVRPELWPYLDPPTLAQSIVHAGLLPGRLGPRGGDILWAESEPLVDEFLVAAEERSGVARLARRVRRLLEVLVQQHSHAPLPRVVGSTMRVAVEATRPIEGMTAPPGVERIQCEVTATGQRLGNVEVPVVDGVVPALVVADAIASVQAWPILCRFFEQDVYRQAHVEPDAQGLWRWRGNLLSTADVRTGSGGFLQDLHDRAGWTVFLQELWGRPEWPSDRFYDAAFVEEPTQPRAVEGDWVTVEVSDDLQDLAVTPGPLTVEATVGGVALGTVGVTATGPRVPAQALRAAITEAAGVELCVVAVREALLGTALSPPSTLRARIAEAARRAVRPVGSSAVRVRGASLLSPNWSRAASRALGGGGGTIVGRRAAGSIGSSASRRATLPATVVHEVVASTELDGEPIVVAPGPERDRVVYAPDLLWSGPAAGAAAPRPEARSETGRAYGRHDFERLFATGADPWKYTTPYEQVKYAQTLALVPAGPVARALELGCAEGHFTAQLAPKVEHLVAADISTLALERARARTGTAGDVEFIHFDLVKDAFPGRFDLIVCSEMLYYVADRRTLPAFAAKIADALGPGGHFLTAHPNMAGDEPGMPGFDWDASVSAKDVAEVFGALPQLRFLVELRTVPYRIQLFRREDGATPRARPMPPERVIEAEYGEMAPSVAARLVSADKAPPRTRSATVTTERLPILMYHRVAPTGASAAARYRVTPEAFEAQLAYLRDSGFRDTNLIEWSHALRTRRPLPGRAVLFTFDDGYRDFATHAWPLLRRYGFGAVVFLVSGLIGKTNRWDAAMGEEVPLLGWDEIRRLRDEGVWFGSHSATHAPLTALAPEEIVREAATSRLALERGLGHAVTAFAYPYGDADQVVHHLCGACGYLFGLSCEPGPSTLHDSAMALPRIEIMGGDGLEQFALKLDV